MVRAPGDQINGRAEVYAVLVALAELQPEQTGFAAVGDGVTEADVSRSWSMARRQ